MIAHKFIKEKMKEFQVRNYLNEILKNVGYSHVEIQKVPLGTRIVIYAAKPGLIVGRKGANINEIVETLKNKFNIENPQLEVKEVEVQELDPQIMAERVANQLYRFGVSRFKAIGHKNIERIMKAGAIGAEIKIAGKVPGKRANYWRFFAGYLPKCGQIAQTQVLKGFKAILLPPGIVGVTVKILPPNVEMPDDIKLKVEEKKVEVQVESGELTKEEKEEMEKEEERLKQEELEGKTNGNNKDERAQKNE
ncbi:MAG: 30S ribosomal protein S3 [Candidatus Parvarchaeota archaeon]|nr:30S ribosomal protein S3 [Candidatus Jingweiarchaeum tengchongense]MCW1297799.1 30S ribosomal protein S3 [Candidatus Jingweiarchaeum tengchongense]MCW1299809.1 30S ribosomal protein S3 [Candidatus Jingweiarchaeum tengchongense]MCW1304220.1 30S ribosomal protein S3 [Candidatus Jingweiarchaeum tengchongense]MCW1305248.1 30S ribosomal protein S3 [Candidatus Jingweiarchaeum tengchongense]